MQGLLKLGKKLYEYHLKSEITFKKAYEYAKRKNVVSGLGSAGRLDVAYFMKDYPNSKSRPSYSSLADIKDPEFIKLVKDYVKYLNIIKNYEDLIRRYKNCGHKKNTWILYRFKNSRDPQLPLIYNAPCNSWESFLDKFIDFGYYYKTVKQITDPKEIKRIGDKQFMKGNR